MSRWASSVLDALTEAAIPTDGGTVVDIVGRRIAMALGSDDAGRSSDVELPPVELPEPPGGWADPWLVGIVHERAVGHVDRRARGAWYTPRAVVEGLVDLAVGGGQDREFPPPLVVDPTCGGGAFLLAALDRLCDLGLAPDEAVDRIAGMDLANDAVHAAQWSVRLWLLASGLDPRAADDADLVCGDVLTSVPQRWSRPGVVVVGNPPFATPLKTGAIPPAAEQVRSARPDLLGPYADLASIHLFHTVQWAGPGSVIALVQPQSALAGRDTAGLRRHLGELGEVIALWAAREAVFDAGVRACAPILRLDRSSDGTTEVSSVRPAPHGTTEVSTTRPAPEGAMDASSVRPASGPATGVPTIRLASGPDVEPRGLATVEAATSGEWADLAAEALGGPAVPAMSPSAGRLGDLATASAGFRDEHYGLVGACREADADTALPATGASSNGTGRVVTVGSIDPLLTAWGRAPIRFGGTDWERPVVDRAELDAKVGAWFDRRLGPKVLLATQSKVLEPVVDWAGDLVPATPVISIEPDRGDLARVAAVLLAPPVVAWAWRRWLGTALTVDTIKLAARHVAEIPLPADRAAWNDAAALIDDTRGADPSVDPIRAWDLALDVAILMNRAYGASEDVVGWWNDRRKPRPGNCWVGSDPTA